MSDKWSESEIPIWMDNVNCVSNSTNFLLCETNGFGINDCDHSENVLLTCFGSGWTQTNELRKMTLCGKKY